MPPAHFRGGRRGPVRLLELELTCLATSSWKADCGDRILREAPATCQLSSFSDGQRPVDRTGGGSANSPPDNSCATGGRPWRRRAAARTGHSRPPARRGEPSFRPAKISHQSRRVAFPASRHVEMTWSISSAISEYPFSLNHCRAVVMLFWFLRPELRYTLIL